MIYVLQGHSHLISEERRKLISSQEILLVTAGAGFMIVVLIDAVRDCCDALFNCLSPSKKIGDHFSCGSHQICSHRANFSVNVFIHMSSLVIWFI